MQQQTDGRLVAYLDGELDGAARHAVEAELDADPAAAERLAALAGSAALLRAAFDEVLHEPVPERLLAAARGDKQPLEAAPKIPPFARRRVGGGARPAHWRSALPITASILGLLVGVGGTYFALGKFAPDDAKRPGVEAAVNNVWLDNAAGYFKLLASAGDNGLIDVPATGDTREALQKISQNLPQEVRLPNLKPWGLNFRGARLVVVEGRPAAQLVYTTDNKAIGPLTLIIGSSRLPDISPTFDHRQDVNLLYWRHQGRAYALVGRADIGYLWGIGNDVAWQLDAI